MGKEAAKQLVWFAWGQSRMKELFALLKRTNEKESEEDANGLSRAGVLASELALMYFFLRNLFPEPERTMEYIQ